MGTCGHRGKQFFNTTLSFMPALTNLHHYYHDLSSLDNSGNSKAGILQIIQQLPLFHHYTDISLVVGTDHQPHIVHDHTDTTNRTHIPMRIRIRFRYHIDTCFFYCYQ